MKTLQTTLTRRRALSALGIAAAGVAGINRLFAADHAHHGGTSSGADECARVCAACLIECAKHVHHCTQHVADGHREFARCLELCVASASSCSSCVMACFGPAAADAALGCAKLCDQCAEECGKFKDNAAMQACAESCRACSKACRAFAAN